jgi:hypothetical protein
MWAHLGPVIETEDGLDRVGEIGGNNDAAGSATILVSFMRTFHESHVKSIRKIGDGSFEFYGAAFRRYMDDAQVVFGCELPQLFDDSGIGAMPRSKRLA